MTGARVLIVDDDPALLQALSETLQLRTPSLAVETSDSAPAAVELISSTDYDAIVADIKMPDMDGMQLLSSIRDLRPDTPTLLITGHGEHDLAVQALRGGAHDYVQKPIDRDYFVGSLNHALELRALSRKVAKQKRTLEQQSRKLERCLEDRTHELRELYQREAIARAELEQTSAALEVAKQDREELVAMIAHDLGTPLTTLRGYAELLTRPRVTPTVRDRARSIIRSETDRMARLVQDLVTHPESAAPSRFSIQYGTCDVVTLARDQIELARARSKQHSIVLNAPKRLEVQCDRERVAQILANLLGNALAYTPAGEIRVCVSREARNVRISVADQGPGIPLDSLEEIFEPRVRLARRRIGGRPKGAGLGLSIARQIAEAHGGRIWAESGPDQGAAFNVVLPRSPRRGARTAMRRTAPDSPGPRIGPQSQRTDRQHLAAGA